MDFKSYLIDESASCIDAMKKINDNGKKIVFLESNNKIVASLSDGDIRRWIIKGGNLSVQCKLVANYDFKYLFESDSQKARDIMSTYKINSIPILNDTKCLINIITIDNKNFDAPIKEKIPVVIMAGGFGTRLYPYTKILPKPLIPIGDTPILEHIINRFVEIGIEDFYVIVNHKKNMIKAYFNEIQKDYNLIFVDEEMPLGTGGGLSLISPKITDSFILTNCDILINQKISSIVNHHKVSGNLITMVVATKDVQIPYGTVELDSNGKVSRIVEKPNFNFLTNTGFYVVEPGILNLLEHNKKIDFPDIFEKLNDENQKVGVYPITENDWLDMGQIDELDKMRKKMGYE
ncbi:nucleotidyltransferase family protein [Candidatus Xianfuyuplasma coldseepsis]|uniref:NTP transferase domain-containing protein n=1 Tax=Candidatus Xianfuyuplasma coldseepsis TaxID=2782163 RepID=A0A7L7KPE4_9MOLU|nr:nucleotidyltransferase family protein [Xianfuyuplasma coldseepsis]QMS84527.1 NTP transferase domain-containing protein [Xianfuyuplasma coldseepsis]